MSDSHNPDQTHGDDAPPWTHDHPPSGGRGGYGAQGAPPRNWHRDDGSFDPHRKSPRAATFLSLIPGLGQIYIGYYMRGFVLAGVIFMLITLVNVGGRELEGAALWATLFTWLFGMIDAGRMAALYNHAVAGGESIELPKDFKVPRMEGSIVAGVWLTLFGLIMLSNTLFDYPLRWLRDWWPIFPLAIGVYLLARGVIDYNKAHQPPRPREDSLMAETE
jgi:hypothetical protein